MGGGAGWIGTPKKRRDITNTRKRGWGRAADEERKPWEVQDSKGER